MRIHPSQENVRKNGSNHDNKNNKGSNINSESKLRISAPIYPFWGAEIVVFCRSNLRSSAQNAFCSFCDIFRLF